MSPKTTLWPAWLLASPAETPATSAAAATAAGRWKVIVKGPISVVLAGPFTSNGGEECLKANDRYPWKRQLPQYLKVPVVGDQEIRTGRDGYVHKFIVVGVVGDELPFVVGFLPVRIGREGQHIQHGGGERGVAPREYLLVLRQNLVADNPLERLGGEQVIQCPKGTIGADRSHQAMGVDNGSPHQNGSFSIRS